MKSAASATILLAVFVHASVAGVSALPPDRTPDWTRFRGPNGSGVSAAKGIPTTFNSTTNLLWRLEMPPGHSSPILFGDRLYLTAFRGDQLFTIAVDRNAGKILWERESPVRAKPVVDKRNSPASPSPAVDDSGIYVFFQDYGMIAYDAAGGERWKMPLGPFNNIYGMGASPIVVGDLVILSCDQSTDSFVIAVNKKTGKQVWKTARPEAKSGHVTPIVWRGPDGKDQILIAGSFLLTAYDPATGAKRWWVRGLSFEMKSTPVIGNGTIFINGYGSTENEPGQKVVVPSAETVWATADADHNGVLSRNEFPKYTAAFWFGAIDLDHSGTVNKEEWEYYRSALDSENSMMAIKLGGSGDMTDTAIKWKYTRSIPQLPSPLLYHGVLYMVNESGVVTTLNPDTGALIKQGRLAGALGDYRASPIAADDHIFFVSRAGAVAVLPANGDLTPLVVNDLKEDCYATPALSDGHIYVRSTEALWAFGTR